MAFVDGFGPDRLPSAIVLTFDNLGEASALERGTHAPDVPLGRDPSVTQALPWLLGVLDRHALTATFFVEAINCELYPGAVREIAARGHELGHHGWTHETWSELSPENERDALTRGVAEFEKLGLAVRGFRPPGGGLTERTPSLLRELGLEWCSPVGGAPALDGGLTYVLFDWDLVDAYHLMDSFARLRVRRGDPEAARTPAQVEDRFAQRLRTAGAHTLILHPFLMLDPAWQSGVSGLLASIAELAQRHRAWVVRGEVFADWLLRQT